MIDSSRIKKKKTLEKKIKPKLCNFDCDNEPIDISKKTKTNMSLYQFSNRLNKYI